MASLIASTQGELFIGLIIAAIFYGSTVVQTYIYFDYYGSDKILLKLFVLLIVVLETAHLCTVIYACWIYLIDSFGSPLTVEFLFWPVSVQLYLPTFITFFVQIFYAWRIRILASSMLQRSVEMRLKMLCAIILVTSTVHIAFSFYYAISVSRATLWTELDQYTWVADIGIGNSIAADLLIAGTMVYIFRTHQSDFSTTQSVMNRLIGYSVGTGAVTSVFAISVLLMFAATSTSLAPEMLYVMLSKTYANALLVQLNSRRRMNRVLHGTDGLVMSLDTRLRFAARSRASKTGEPEVLARYDSAASSRVGIGNSSGDAMTVRGDIRDGPGCDVDPRFQSYA